MVQTGAEVINIIAQLFTSSTVKRVWFASQVLVQPLRKTNLKQGFVWHWIVQVCYSNKMLTIHSWNTQQKHFLVLCWRVQNITVALVFPQQSGKVLIHWSSNIFFVCALLTGAKHHSCTGVPTQRSKKVLIHWSSNRIFFGALLTGAKHQLHLCSHRAEWKGFDQLVQ